MDDEELDEEALTDEEIEEQIKEVEDKLKEHQGYIGKFNSLQNQLNAVTKQLDVLSSKGFDRTILAERYDRIASLSQELAEVLAHIKDVQDQVKEAIKKDTTVEEIPPVTTIPPTKEWKIKFNKKLDKNTLSNLDIIVMDSEKNIIETTFSYSDKTETVTITSLQHYTAGETYTLYIGKQIAANNGLTLKNSYKMNFSIK